MTWGGLIEKFVARFRLSLKARYEKSTDLDESIKRTVRAVQCGDVSVDLRAEDQYLRSRNDGKGFWELLGEDLAADETTIGRLHNRAKRLHWSRIAKDVSAGLREIIATLVKIFG